MKKFNELLMHEEIIIKSEFSDVSVMRVPGGWIYTHRWNAGQMEGGSISSVFVPYFKETRTEE